MRRPGISSLWQHRCKSLLDYIYALLSVTHFGVVRHNNSDARSDGQQEKREGARYSR